MQPPTTFMPCTHHDHPALPLHNPPFAAYWAALCAGTTADYNFSTPPKKTQTIKKQILSLLGLAAPKIGNSALSQQQ
jgi:hypothetical protein